MNRIPCPHCGERDLEEFYYGGDATLQRPAMSDHSIERWHDFVYLRDNPRGPHRELWYHTTGCRRWFEITRDTLTHDISAVKAELTGAQNSADNSNTVAGDSYA